MTAYPALDAISTFMVCGCLAGGPHEDGCRLGEAEAIALCAAGDAITRNAHQLQTAVYELVASGLLCDLPEPTDPAAADRGVDILLSFVDWAWQNRLIVDSLGGAS